MEIKDNKSKFYEQFEKVTGVKPNPIFEEMNGFAKPHETMAVGTSIGDGNVNEIDTAEPGEEGGVRRSFSNNIYGNTQPNQIIEIPNTTLTISRTGSEEFSIKNKNSPASSLRLLAHEAKALCSVLQKITWDIGL